MEAVWNESISLLQCGLHNNLLDVINRKVAHE